MPAVKFYEKGDPSIAAKQAFYRLRGMVVTHDCVPRRPGALLDRLPAEYRDSLKHLKSSDIESDIF